MPDPTPTPTRRAPRADLASPLDGGGLLDSLPADHPDLPDEYRAPPSALEDVPTPPAPTPRRLAPHAVPGSAAALARVRLLNDARAEAIRRRGGRARRNAPLDAKRPWVDEAVRLYLDEGLSQPQIAARLGISRPTVSAALAAYARRVVRARAAHRRRNRVRRRTATARGGRKLSLDVPQDVADLIEDEARARGVPFGTAALALIRRALYARETGTGPAPEVPASAPGYHAPRYPLPPVPGQPPPSPRR